MKLPLHVSSPGPGKPRDIHIGDARGKIVCIVPEGEAAGYIAEQIIGHFNVPWWRHLLPRPRDERQRAYDKWVWETNKGSVL